MAYIEETYIDVCIENKHKTLAALRKALGVEKEAIENSTIRVCPCVCV